MYIMGIDVGTSGCKAAVFDSSGNMVVCTYRGYRLIYPEPGAMELDPNEVWNAVCACITECGTGCQLSQVQAVAVSSQGEAMIPVNEEGRVLCNAPVTFDSRNENEYLWFQKQFDRLQIMKITGMPIHPMFSATKIIWMKKNYPEIYRSTWKLFCFSDFIAFRLGSNPCMEYSLASRTMLFDISQKKWSQEILETCEIDERKLPEVVPSGTVIGTISEGNVKRFEFPPDCVIVSGGHDQLCCSLGAGVLQSGEIMDSLGTTESMVCVSDNLILTDKMMRSNIPCSVYPIPGLYAYMTFLTGSGSILSWLKEKFFNSKNENFYFHFDNNVENNYYKPSEIFVLPYFSGSGTPNLDFRAKGMIAGLTLDTNQYQIYQAAIEATCLEGKINLTNMESCGIAVKELRCIGGGSRSNIWLKMKADITGRRVLSMKISEAGCLGAAILAGVGCGVFQNTQDAVDRFVHVGAEYLPDPERHGLYEEKFQKYQLLYPAAKQMGL